VVLFITVVVVVAGLLVVVVVTVVVVLLVVVVVVVLCVVVNTAVVKMIGDCVVCLAVGEDITIGDGSSKYSRSLCNKLFKLIKDVDGLLLGITSLFDIDIPECEKMPIP
jgi:hypothetical protein